MGYADIRHNRQHEADAARITELEEQLRREKASRADEGKSPPQPAAPQAVQPQASPQQTVVVNNEGCLTGAGKGCLSVIIGILILAAVGQLVAMFSKG